jgi:hypothetical protein
LCTEQKFIIVVSLYDQKFMISISMDMQEDEIKEKNRRIEYAEQCLTALNLELKVCFLEPVTGQ